MYVHSAMAAMAKTTGIYNTTLSFISSVVNNYYYNCLVDACLIPSHVSMVSELESVWCC